MHPLVLLAGTIAVASLVGSLHAATVDAPATGPVATRSDPAVARAVAEAVAELPTPPAHDPATRSDAMTRALAGPGRCSTLEAVAKVALVAAYVRANCQPVTTEKTFPSPPPGCYVGKAKL